ncbi:precorrin-8X methylmutase [Pseudomonas aeruginosa NCGM2.S1]|nr:precorrin-8X methylmutase [Pseudomonas aeruginosa NCGM2.S1]
MIDYIRDGQAIYRQSFATIRAEANLAGIPADLEKLAVRVIHACGMVDVVDDLRFSPGAGAAASCRSPIPLRACARPCPPPSRSATGWRWPPRPWRWTASASVAADSQ